MLILLPPSEGKTPATGTNPVEMGDLSFPQLTEARERVVEELAQVSAEEGAAEQLKVGKSLVAEVERNTRLLAEPAAPAAQVYTGVLFEALDYASLGTAAQESADRSLLVISALWGAVSLKDCIPAYRLSMGVKLGSCGNLAKFWAGELTSVLSGAFDGQLVIDCRSAAYAKAWTPEPQLTYAVRVEKMLPDGSRKVVSHMAKHYRGLLARYLIDEGLTNINNNNIEQLLPRLSPKFTVELSAATDKKPGTLTLVVKE